MNATFTNQSNAFSCHSYNSALLYSKILQNPTLAKHFLKMVKFYVPVITHNGTYTAATKKFIKKIFNLLNKIDLILHKINFY